MKQAVCFALLCLACLTPCRVGAQEEYPIYVRDPGAPSGPPFLRRIPDATLTSTGTLAVPTIVLGGTPIVLHDPVTLSADLANNLLGLSAQLLSLDNQTANIIFAGPTSGGAAAPAFRSLVDADIPDLSATYQPLDSDLTTIAGLTATSGAFIRGTGAAWATSALLLPNAATANRVVYAPSANTLGESANLTFNGSALAIGKTASGGAAFEVDALAGDNTSGMRIYRDGNTTQYIGFGTFTTSLIEAVQLNKDFVIQNSDTGTGDLGFNTGGANRRMTISEAGAITMSSTLEAVGAITSGNAGSLTRIGATINSGGAEGVSLYHNGSQAFMESVHSGVAWHSINYRGATHSFAIGSTERLNIGTAGQLAANTTGVAPLTLVSTDAGASAAVVDFFRNSASPAANDLLYTVQFSGKSSTGVTRNYATVAAAILDPTNGAEDSRLDFTVMSAGALTTALRLRSWSSNAVGVWVGDESTGGTWLVPGLFSGDPVDTPAPGAMWHNGTTNTWRGWDGTNYVTFDTTPD
jgi:hypothetical protein